MSTYTPHYFEALLLDANLLCLVLERNRKQHFRAAYFRRLDMLVRSLQRNTIINLNPKNNEKFRSLGDITVSLKTEHNRVASILERCKGLQKRRGKNVKVEEEHWSITNEDCEDKIIPALLLDLKSVHKALTEQLPEILSRINYAASALYTELSRGYFAPLCTVALACISRVRVLILRLGTDGVLQLQRIVGWLESEYLRFASVGGDLEKATGLSVRQVKQLQRECLLKQDLLSRFMDDNNEKGAQLQRRKNDRILMRGIQRDTVGNDPSIETGDDEALSSQKSPNSEQDMQEDLIGELLHSSSSKASAKGVLEDEPKDHTVDRNLEMISLLKEKKAAGGKLKNPKKRKITNLDEASEKIENRKIKISKTEKEFSGNSGIEDKKKDKKKKKTKKKKKKSNDIIDDIFDGL